MLTTTQCSPQHSTTHHNTVVLTTTEYSSPAEHSAHHNTVLVVTTFFFAQVRLQFKDVGETNAAHFAAHQEFLTILQERLFLSLGEWAVLGLSKEPEIGEETPGSRRSGDRGSPERETPGRRDRGSPDRRTLLSATPRSGAGTPGIGAPRGDREDDERASSAQISSPPRLRLPMPKEAGVFSTSSRAVFWDAWRLQLAERIKLLRKAADVGALSSGAGVEGFLDNDSPQFSTPCSSRRNNSFLAGACRPKRSSRTPSPETPRSSAPSTPPLPDTPPDTPPLPETPPLPMTPGTPPIVRRETDNPTVSVPDGDRQSSPSRTETRLSDYLSPRPPAATAPITTTPPARRITPPCISVRSPSPQTQTAAAASGVSSKAFPSRAGEKPPALQLLEVDKFRPNCFRSELIPPAPDRSTGGKMIPPGRPSFIPSLNLTADDLEPLTFRSELCSARGITAHSSPDRSKYMHFGMALAMLAGAYRRIHLAKTVDLFGCSVSTGANNGRGKAEEGAGEKNPSLPATDFYLDHSVLPGVFVVELPKFVEEALIQRKLAQAAATNCPSLTVAFGPIVACSSEMLGLEYVFYGILVKRPSPPR